LRTPRDYPARFAVLHHIGLFTSHYDLMIEAAGGAYLHAWRCRSDPLSQYLTLAERVANRRPVDLTPEALATGSRKRVTRVHVGAGRVFRTTRRIWALVFDEPSAYEYPGYLFCRPPTIDQWLFEGWTPFPAHWLKDELPSQYFAARATDERSASA
jgi:hypothetical protein